VTGDRGVANEEDVVHGDAPGDPDDKVAVRRLKRDVLVRGTDENEAVRPKVIPIKAKK